MQSLRQSELFASKDWQVLYQAFNTINFNASDPTSINQALRDYIAVNYPEDFNDWIESSEFVAIIDLLSWIAGTLAFKMDINARENFLETAEARESVLRLARFLSYTPRRNRPATGLVKLVEVSTDDDIVDSTGSSLTGVRVQWNNPDDNDWFERFTTVLNSAFVSTNQFGTPLKSATINDVKTNVYRLNCLMGSNNFAFNSFVSGQTMDFELCNGDFNDIGAFVERNPDNNAAFNFFYRNDGNGNGSIRTGFFMLFKQGTSVKQNFRIDYPIENQVLDLSTAGVNETDVWVQTVSDLGEVLLDWSKVPAIFSSNITYTNLNNTDRNIFSVITKSEDRASVRFSNGIFANAPVGNIRVWYRTSNGKLYQIKPNEINRITQTIKYYNKAGVIKNLRLVFSLQETVSNAAPRETDDQIRERAPSVYATQNRMVSGEDYNTFPLSANIASKLKAVNRVYAGHSRFVDLNDPTSTYTDVVVTADDGIFYQENSNLYQEIPLSLNRTATELVSNTIQPLLRKTEVRNYIYGQMMDRINTNAEIPEISFNPNTTWNRVTTARYSSSGWFSYSNSYFTVGSTLKFLLPDNVTYKWVSIVGLTGSATDTPPETGTRGPVTLSENIPTGAKLVKIIPALTTELPSAIVDNLVNRFSDNSDLHGFSLWYDPELSTWIVRDDIVSLSVAPDYNDIIHVMTVEYYANMLWRFSAHGKVYVFESARKVKWYYNGENVLDSETGEKRYDTIEILQCNQDFHNTSNYGFTSDKVVTLTDMYYYGDGTQEPRRIKTNFIDKDSDGYPDDPDTFGTIISSDTKQNTLFWQINNVYNQTSYAPINTINVFDIPVANVSQIPNTIRTQHGVTTFTSGDLIYITSTDTFYKRVNTTWVEQPRRDYRIATGRGFNTAKRWMVLDSFQNDLNQDGFPDDGGDRYVIMYSTNSVEVAAQGLSPSVGLIKNGALTFKWKHYAPIDHRIDPSITNIVDIFMLTSEYDLATRQWIANGADMTELPSAPSESDLRILMSDYENYKMFSDEIVWRPVTYKFLFGNGSDDQNLKASFKVVKLPSTTLADGEIKSRIITAINEFFDINRWDFGETFYYTELAAFVHQQLVGHIGSIVLVPLSEDSSFGDGFEIHCRSDEIFISTAQVNDVEIISANTSTNLRIR